MTTVAVVLIVAALAIAAIIIVTVSVAGWSEAERARHASNAAISHETAQEIKAELAEIKENLAAINKMLREVQ